MYQLQSLEAIIDKFWWVLPIFILCITWSVIWKGIALWKSARNGSKAWFIVLLLVNTIGILEIIYVFVFSKKEKNAD
ncbi:MAG: hypothetical protein ACD_51C00204G0002 [uncultured bacterium]|nr:MAG: hypothetical protein ACD_51C00204G0002 [uncultured bacterium]OGJ48106.1 MAG: hypothetical protein A2244_01295 [Candidatus Peregrinibacteria bacterium RIFOXYA2_FULL_41_18]OGJ49009.1 MAG: hypothetical protein A2344_00540 [Candidatus Peregrinibacteria bacterium RIFOXYB12_FULL_41_12]OGJ53230.1 MAG: hypothetical protein A2448_04865 [Candidatus Peregrinibacteria bacterium RIFOXYC2_FULL_41_22]OGJ54240.1 MAG: hypothetical protein A2336_02050 [Candidatus Peregrinibacteria bacterium RIFOXYB2_FULL